MMTGHVGVAAPCFRQTGRGRNPPSSARAVSIGRGALRLRGASPIAAGCRAGGSAAQPFDRIPIAIRTSWSGLVAAIESAIPTCREGAADAACPDSAGVDSFILHEEDTWHPIEERMLGQQLAVQGSAWRREPLAVSIEGTRFSASLRLQYRVRIGMLRGRQLGSCGYGELPRELTVRLTGDLRFAPEWYVDPSFAVELIPESRCRASMLNFDITRFSDRFDQGEA